MYFGKIKFFDCRVNNFGFIDNIYPKEIEDDKIYVSGDDVLCNKNLLADGNEVVFEIKEIGKRKRAIDVNLLSNLSLQEKQKLSLLFDGDKLHKFVYDLLRDGVAYTSEEKNIICNKIIENPMLIYPYYTLDILRIINDNKYLNKFIQFLINADDLNKLNLSKGDKELLPVIANHWLFQNEKTTQDLIKKIKESSPSSDVYQQFILTFQKELQKHIPNTIINFYSIFYDIKNITDFIKSIKDVSTYEIIRESITKCFIDEKRQELFSILSNHIIDNYSLFREKLNDSHKFQLIINAEKGNIEKILSGWIGNNSIANKDLLKEINNSQKYFSYSSIINSIIKRILDNDNITNFYFYSSDYLSLEKYFEYLLLYNDYNFLEYLIKTKLFVDAETFKHHLIQFTKPEVVLLLKKILTDSNDLEVKTKIEAIIFLTNENIPSITSVENVAHLAISYLQQYVLKKIISLLQKGKINNSLFNEFLNIQEWTSLSALLIISFIQNKPNDKTSALDCLSYTFKEHLSRVANSGIEENFEQLFTINSIVKMCNGRKYYQKTLWQRDNTIRYYSSKNNMTISEPMQKYCEGRFWKNEQLYDSESNTPFMARLFWCRGGICYGLNTKADLNLEFTDLTLVEISTMYKINLDELIFSIIGGWANRMNEIIEKLRCRKCNSILRPLPFNPRQLGHYATPLFNCLIENCSEYKKQIRFTHCLNGKCEKLLDSRDLKNCSEGWMICTCGTCCPKHSGREYTPKYVQ